MNTKFTPILILIKILNKQQIKLFYKQHIKMFKQKINTIKQNI
jgi:hypothetical protein